jgi:hypothetical protein
MARTLGRIILCLFLVGASVGADGLLQVGGRTYAVVGDCDQRTYSILLLLTPPPGRQETKALSVLFSSDAQGNGYRLDASAGGWTLLSLRDGASRELARGKADFLPARKPLELLIKRRDWLLSVALNGRVLAAVADADHFAGLVAVDPLLTGPGGEPLLQAVGPLLFQDTFMRTADELTLDPWKGLTGKWGLHSVQEDLEDLDVSRLPEGRRPQSERSSNPFSVSGHADGSGLLAAGNWFWDDYEASAAVRNDGVRAVGLAFSVRSPQDLFLLRWENGSEVLAPTRVQLLRVRPEGSEELAHAWVNGQLKQWYKPGVRLWGNRVQALLDDAVIMDVRNDELVGGQVGLYVEGGDDKREAIFDDILVRSISGYDCDDTVSLTDYAAGREGRWDAARVQREARPDNCAAVLRSPTGRLAFGHAGWPPSLISARVTAPAKGQEVGFEAALGAEGAGSYRVTLTRDADGPRLYLEEVGPGGPTELASCRDFAAEPGEPVELAADLTRSGEVNVYVGGDLRLHLARQDAGKGAVAVFARRFRGAEVRDLRIAFRREEDSERLPVEEIFREDPFMKHWSSPEGAWWPVSGRADAWWHVGDFYGRSELEVPLDPRVLVLQAAENLSRDDGYALVQEQADAAGGDSAPKSVKLALLRLGTPVAEATVLPEGDSPKVVLYKEKPYLWVTYKGREVIAYRDPKPLPGTRLALVGAQSGQLPAFKLQRSHVRDYYFEEAPSDWHLVGDWRVTARFACDPRWSFMTARATQNAVLFNKFRYHGDATLEAFMGARMNMPGQGGQYWRVGDYNLALCADPLGLGRGYNFVVGGWDRFWSDRSTYLLKDGRQLAGTTQQLLPNVRRENTQSRVIPVPWISGGRDIHGAWYYIKARKKGGELTSYVDNHPAYSFTDSAPLEEFTPAVWTYDAQVVVARVKISYEHRDVPGRLVAPPEREEPTEAPARPAPLIVSASHPGFRDDFEGGWRGWSTYEGQQSAALRIGRRPGGSGQALQVTDAGGGGLFEAIAPLEDACIRAADVWRVAFDYRVPPEALLNLFFKIGGQYYYVRLNGPDETNAFYRRIGEVQVHADGKWHRGEFALGAAMRQAGVEGTALVESAVFGNLHRGLLQAGIGGNPPGASYWIDNFEVVSAGSADFRAACRPADLAEGGAVLGCVDGRRATVPDTEQPLDQQTLQPGEWTCHTRVKLADGTLGGVAHLPFVVCEPQLGVSAVLPSAGASWGYGPIELDFGGPNAPWLDAASLRLKVNGEPAAGQGLFETDWLHNRLRLNMQWADVRMPDGEPVRFELAYADRFGRPGAFQWEYVASVAGDRTPPTAVDLVGYLLPQGFEADTAPWESSRDVTVLRDDSTAASGRWSLMVQNLRWASGFLVYPIKGEFGAGAYPLVEFDYKVHDGVQFDMVANNAGGFATVGLSDRCRYGSYVGEVSDFTADDRWHHAEFNLMEALRKVPYARDLFRQRWLALGDFGYRSNAVGAYYNVDNFQPVPLVSGLSELRLRCAARDAGGIRGYSYLWSSARKDTPDDTVDSEAPTAAFSHLPSPDAFFHVKACDAAGNWGPVSHFRFRVDDASPQLVEATPAAGSRSASSEIVVRLADDGSAVDPETLTLTVGEADYRPYSPGVQYDCENGRLVWNWVTGRPEGQRGIPDGAPVRVRVRGADFAGNPLPDQQWEWTMDHSLDKDPPTRPTLAAVTMPVKEFQDFQTGTGSWRNRRGNETGAGLKQIWRDEGSGDYCLQLSASRDNGFFDAVAYEQRYDLTQYPLLSFDYRMPQQVRANVQVSVNNVWYDVKMTASNLAGPLLGSVSDIRADNAWHCATVDLLAMARQALPRAPRYEVQGVCFGDAGRSGNRRNAEWCVDNFMIHGYGAQRAEFRWRSDDITGVAGYCAVLDEEMATVPPQRVTTQGEAGRFGPLKPGTHWLHVAAYDGNGNWSRPSHLAYVVAPPQEATPAESAPPGRADASPATRP